MDESLSSCSTFTAEDTGAHSSNEADDESESDLASPAPRKRYRMSFSPTAFRGAASYKTLYKSDWEKQFPVSPANDNKYAFYCIPCKRNISCSHMGKADVKQHCETSTHKRMEQAIKSSRSLRSFVPSASSSLQDKTIKAEVLHTNFIVQHSLAFLTADHLSPLYAKMFPDSQIAQHFKCCRTKTTSILNEAIRPQLREQLILHMRENPFSFSHDGSSDTSLKKMNPVCVTIFDINNSSRVETKFYDMCVTTGEDCGKAEVLFQAIDNNFIGDSIDWKNVIAVGLDNTNVNMGCNNSIKTRILDKNPDSFIAGCNCHLSHLAASKGADAFSSVTGFDIEDHEVDIYYYFSKSTKRKGILLEFLDFVDLEWGEIVRYVSTRWLSLEKCCDKEIRKYPALKSMFISRNESDARFLRLHASYEDPLTEIFVYFYTSALPMFTHYNMFLQRSDPLAHRVYPATIHLAKKVASRFIKPDILRKEEITADLLVNSGNYLPLSEVFIGLTTKTKLNKLLNEGDISQSQWEKCIEGCIAFYRDSLKYIIKSMNLNGSLWEHAVWINFFERHTANWSNIEYFCGKFNAVLRFDEHSYECLHEEFLDYKSLRVEELPASALQEAFLSEKSNDDHREYRMDIIWYHLRQLKTPVASNLRFKLLFEVARLALVLPNSNAGIERVFSLVNKNKREGSDRNRLDIEGSLSSILSVKLERPESVTKCYEFVPDLNLLKNAKKATRTYNTREHQ